jgi:hypothetical protein
MTVTSAREQELLELQQRANQVQREMLAYVLRRTLPDPEQLQTWMHVLGSSSSMSFTAGAALDVDQRPLQVEGRIILTRASVETSCCLHHAVNSVVSECWNGIFESMEKALWRLPKTRYPHDRSAKH